jgi:L-amino acid N-acyltransferase YncA
VPILIRDVRPDDAQAVAGILNGIIEAGAYTVLDRVFSVDEERRFIEAFPPRGTFLVAESTEDRTVLGFQNVEPFATYTRAFDHVGVIGTFVDLDHRRQGVSAQLFLATFDAAEQKGYRKLFAYIRGDNPSAKAAYAAHGFRVVGIARDQARIGDRYVDEVIVEKFLRLKPRSPASPSSSSLG